MKHSKFIFTLLFFIAVGFSGFGQTINVPPDHETSGTLNPPIGIDPSVQIDVWSFVNNSDCDLSITVWFTVNNLRLSINRTVLSGGSISISSVDVLNLFGLGSASTITKSSMNICQNGSPNTQIGVSYPGDNERKSNNEISEGCDCVHVNWNETTRVITFSNC
ncbi:MAG: hypothetical protein KA981_02725 [Bacteroidia bacterium]|jgi:hypothetical protein|nr:hypothetical protein [Bacteroidia bacterium]